MATEVEALTVLFKDPSVGKYLVPYLTERARKDKDGNEFTATYATKSEIPSKTSALENDSGFLTAHQDISGKVNVSGSRGALAGYEMVGASTTVSADSSDSSQTDSAVTVNNGAEGTSWVKIVRLTAAVTVTLGSNWVWQGGSAPTIAAGGVLVCCWCGSGGIAQFVSPS